MGKQNKETNKQITKLIDTDNRTMVTRGQGSWEDTESKGDQMHGDGRRLGLGW